jgi:hypothetical protein
MEREGRGTYHINFTPGKSGMKVGSNSAMLLKFIPLGHQTTGSEVRQGGGREGWVSHQ